MKNETKETLKKETPAKKVVAKKTAKTNSSNIKNDKKLTVKTKTTTKSKAPVKKETTTKEIVEVKPTNEVTEEKIVDNTSSEVIVKENSNVKTKNCNRKRWIKAVFYGLFIIIIIVGITIAAIYETKHLCKTHVICSKKKVTPKEDKLPKPEVTTGERGALGIDKNINEKTIDKYLGRKDAVYRDMRMLVDPGQYEKIGGDRYLSGYIDGFEVVPLPYIIKVTGLPEEVGDTYQGNTLFFTKSDGTYAPNYEESIDIIEKLFPKDKIIFLMCGGGGYAGLMKQFLVSMGWNADKIYVVGGHWYYNGKHNIEVKKVSKDGKITYDFDNVPYHEIEFEDYHEIKPDKHDKEDVEPFKLESKYYNLTELKEYESLNPYTEKGYSEENKEKLINYVNNLLKNKESFVMTVYADVGCGDDDEETARTRAIQFAKENNIYFYDIDYDFFEQTDLYLDVKYAPAVLIYKNGKIYTYTDPESDEDYENIKSQKAFNKWMKKYIITDIN